MPFNTRASPGVTLTTELLTENVECPIHRGPQNPASKLAPAGGTLQRYRLMEWLLYINSSSQSPRRALLPRRQ